jgi:ribosomal protein S18 acetylase RimI-like enzyme
VSSAELRVRAAGPADVPALHALVERAYRGDSARVGWSHEADLLEGQRTDPGELSRIVADPARVMLMAEADGVLVGCVQLIDEGEGQAYLGMLSIEPGLQASGLGRRLLAEAEEEAVRRFGARRLRMTVIAQRDALIAWYERRGYALTGEREPFPMDDEHFGIPLRRDLEFVVLAKEGLGSRE